MMKMLKPLMQTRNQTTEKHKALDLEALNVSEMSNLALETIWGGSHIRHHLFIAAEFLLLACTVVFSVSIVMQKKQLDSIPGKLCESLDSINVINGKLNGLLEERDRNQKLYGLQQAKVENIAHQIENTKTFYNNNVFLKWQEAKNAGVTADIASDEMFEAKQSLESLRRKVCKKLIAFNTVGSLDDHAVRKKANAVIAWGGSNKKILKIGLSKEARMYFSAAQLEIRPIADLYFQKQKIFKEVNANYNHLDDDYNKIRHEFDSKLTSLETEKGNGEENLLSISASNDKINADMANSEIKTKDLMKKIDAMKKDIVFQKKLHKTFCIAAPTALILTLASGYAAKATQ